jgi:hypothetical protein
LNGTNTNNILIGNNGLSGTNSETRIGSGSQTKTFISAIRNVVPDFATTTVLIDINGQLGTASSLRELKDNIVSVNENENHIKLMKLQPSRFNYKTCPTVNQFGLIAEDVEDAYPELAAYDMNGKLETVYYNHLPIVLLTEIQRQNKIIANLEQRLDALEKKSLRGTVKLKI